MTESFKKKQIGLAVACALALGILSGTAGAQDVSNKAYLDDTRNAVVKSGYGLCWHTDFGPPPASTPECDPNYVAYVAPPPVAKSTPVPPPVMAPVEPKAVAVVPEAPAPRYEPPQRPAKRDRN